MKESKNAQIIRTLIDKMFEIAGHSLTYDDVVGRTDEWYMQYSMTEEQRNEWKDWSIAYLKKKRIPRPDLEFGMLDLYCGLTHIKKEDETI